MKELQLHSSDAVLFNGVPVFFFNHILFSLNGGSNNLFGFGRIVQSD